MGSGISKVLEGLYLGGEEVLVIENYSFFKENNVRNVVSLCDVSPPDYLGVKKLHIEAVDGPNYDMYRHLPKIAEFIHEARSKGEGVFVHCKAGVSRSATAVIAYIMSAHGLTVKEAFEYVKLCRHMISPNSGFQKQLIMYGRRPSAEVHQSLMARYDQDLIVKDKIFMQKKVGKSNSKCCCKVNCNCMRKHHQVTSRTQVSVGARGTSTM